jgi:hypothetical protein
MSQFLKIRSTSDSEGSGNLAIFGDFDGDAEFEGAE